MLSTASCSRPDFPNPAYEINARSVNALRELDFGRQLLSASNTPEKLNVSALSTAAASGAGILRDGRAEPDKKSFYRIAYDNVYSILRQIILEPTAMYFIAFSGLIIIYDYYTGSECEKAPVERLTWSSYLSDTTRPLPELLNCERARVSKRYWISPTSSQQLYFSDPGTDVAIYVPRT